MPKVIDLAVMIHYCPGIHDAALPNRCLSADYSASHNGGTTPNRCA